MKKQIGHYPNSVRELRAEVKRLTQEVKDIRESRRSSSKCPWPELPNGEGIEVGALGDGLCPKVKGPDPSD
jgi:hypothetical protein